MTIKFHRHYATYGAASNQIIFCCERILISVIFILKERLKKKRKNKFPCYIISVGIANIISFCREHALVYA